MSAVNLAMAQYYRGDPSAAKTLALRGLALAREMGNGPLEAAALGNLGAIERELGELTASLEHVRASIDLRKRTGAIDDVSLDMAELVLTQLKLDNTAEALRIADELMALDPSEYDLGAANRPTRGSTRVSRPSKDQTGRGGPTELALRLFRERVARLPDAAGRATYENITFNRELSLARSPRRPRAVEVAPDSN